MKTAHTARVANKQCTDYDIHIPRDHGILVVLLFTGWWVVAVLYGREGEREHKPGPWTGRLGLGRLHPLQHQSGNHKFHI